ncbi:hypothetical protein HDU96_007797 [Phlyctochytrium bullatum]|nr:hypothetical protein HDU96_007797 [Phlyctochytrium bullatum]
MATSHAHPHPAPSPGSTRLERRIILVGSLTLIFFFVELAVGVLTGATSLLADAVHMLSDATALVVGLVAARLAKRPASRHGNLTYGYKRAEIVGAFANGVILMALSFGIVLRAAEKFLKPEEMDNPILVLIVGSAGFLINIVGMLAFSDATSPNTGQPSPAPMPRVYNRVYGQSFSTVSSHSGVSQLGWRPQGGNRRESSHHGHDHAHDHHHSHEHPKRSSTQQLRAEQPKLPALIPAIKVIGPATGHPDDISVDVSAIDAESKYVAAPEYFLRIEDTAAPASNDTRLPPLKSTDNWLRTSPPKHPGHHHHHDGKKGSSSASRALFLHALADGFGNIAVIAAALSQLLASGQPWVVYMDPGVSLVITAVVLVTAVPLVRGTAVYLMQGVPSDKVSVAYVRKRIEQMPEVESVAHLHIWSLNEVETIAEVEVVIPDALFDPPLASTLRASPLQILTTILDRIRAELGRNGIARSTVGFKLKSQVLWEEGHDSVLGEMEEYMVAGRDAARMA